MYVEPCVGGNLSNVTPFIQAGNYKECNKSPPMLDLTLAEIYVLQQCKMSANVTPFIGGNISTCAAPSIGRKLLGICLPI